MYLKEIGKYSKIRIDEMHFFFFFEINYLQHPVQKTNKLHDSNFFIDALKKFNQS